MNTEQEEFLMSAFELVGMDRSDAQGKLEALSEEKKSMLLTVLLGVTKAFVVNN